MPASPLNQLARRKGAPATVVSINWSSDLVAAALRGLAHGAVLCNDLEFDAEHGRKSTGRVDVTRVASAAGKVAVQRRLWAERGGTQAPQGRGATAAGSMGPPTDDGDRAVAGPGREGWAVFVGDSVTDLPAMLDADLGIAMPPGAPAGSSPGGLRSSLLELCSAFGVEVRPLGALTASLVANEPEEGPRLSSGQKSQVACGGGLCIYEASDWGDVERLLLIMGPGP